MNRSFKAAPHRLPPITHLCEGALGALVLLAQHLVLLDVLRQLAAVLARSLQLGGERLPLARQLRRPRRLVAGLQARSVCLEVRWRCCR
jgi:hypothetical protein